MKRVSHLRKALDEAPTKPRKLRIAVVVVGTGQFLTASTFPGLTTHTFRGDGMSQVVGAPGVRETGTCLASASDQRR